MVWDCICDLRALFGVASDVHFVPTTYEFDGPLVAFFSDRLAFIYEIWAFVCVRYPRTFGCSLLVCPLEVFHSRQAWMAVLGLHSFCALGHLFSGLLPCTRKKLILRVTCFPSFFSPLFSFFFPPFFLRSHLFYSFASRLVSTSNVLAYDGILI